MDADVHARTQLCKASSAEQLSGSYPGQECQHDGFDSSARLQCVALSEPGCAPGTTQAMKPVLHRSEQIKTQRRRRTAPPAGGARLPSCPPSPFANPNVQAETVPPEPVKPGQLGYQNSDVGNMRSSSPFQRTNAMSRIPAVKTQQLALQQHAEFSGTSNSPATPNAAYVRLQHRLNSPARSHANSVVNGAPVRVVAGFPVSNLSSPKAAMPAHQGVAGHHPTVLAYPQHGDDGHQNVAVQSMTRKLAGVPSRYAAQQQAQDVAPLPLPVKLLNTCPSINSRASSGMTDGLVSRHGCQAGWRWLASIFCSSKH